MNWKQESWVIISGTILISLLCFGAIRAHGAEVPRLNSRVMDQADLLTPPQERALVNTLVSIERETTNQIAVLTITSLEGESIEQYSMRVAEKWKLGYQNKDNGVLLLIAVKDKKARIEVGRGLEGALPDIKCSQIMRIFLTPELKRGNFNKGITDTVIAVHTTAKVEHSTSR